MRSEDLLGKKTPLFGAKVATMLSGLFFVLLEVYWVALFWWSSPARCTRVSLTRKDFTPFGFLWWLLSLYFVAVLTSLLTEVLKNFHAVFGSSDTEVLPVKAAFITMLICLYSYAAIFLIMKLEEIVARKWKALKAEKP